MINIKERFQNIINSTDYKIAIASMSDRISNKSQVAPNEATVESYFEQELFSFFREKFGTLGFDYNPIKEKNAARHTLRGRADSALSSLIIEFKQPSTLSSKKDKDSAIEQIGEYMKSLYDGEQRVLYGFITDGTKGCFVEYGDDKFEADKYYNLDGIMLDKLIRCIIQVELVALNANNLVSMICNPPENNGIAFKLAKTLYKTIEISIHPKSQMLYDEWRQLFNLAHDDVSKQQAIIDRRKSLEDIFRKDFSENDEEYKALFCIQTAYAIIVKLIAFKVISWIKYNKELLNFYDLTNYDSHPLRKLLEDLENGAIFKDYGINNLLEGDFFSWYTNAEQWNNEIANDIKQLSIVLSRFSDTPSLKSSKGCQDFFKALYQTMMPPAVRHSLGEYYTKKWLAKNTIMEIYPQLPNNWKALDPCCGSGTFITVLIELVLKENKYNKLEDVLRRVKGIDLNPIAVMTARVNYFINISHLIVDGENLEIPIYLGDASYVPKNVLVDGVKCLEYTISTLQEPINILVPLSMVKNPSLFSITMSEIEIDIKALNTNAVYTKLLGLCQHEDRKSIITDNIQKLAEQLIKLEKRQWNGVWARIITNFLTTANLGKYDLVVGNPPWVDWKSLPSGYRDKIKSLCISRHLFSGDGFTGGINLNICALITNVAAQNWLSSEGYIAFLMPEPLIFQQSYEGFRNLILNEDKRLYFKEFVNWNKAGHPFKPVTQKFLTYYIGNNKVDYSSGVTVKHYIKKKGKNIDNDENIDIESSFDVEMGLLGVCHDNKNFFSYAYDIEDLKKYSCIAGTSNYIGREGIEFYPQELLVFKLSGMPSPQGLTALENIQNDKSKYHVPLRRVLLETEFLHPMIKGKDVIPFHANISDYIVPFPYEIDEPQIPISYNKLMNKAPHLSKYYQQNKDILISQTGYSDKIIGNRNAEFYAIARVGAYSFQKNYVVMRDNSKWAAAVLSDIETTWGGVKRPVFQNHAITICEDSEGRYITLDEAHYICGILNSSIVKQFMMTSSDSRSFPIRPRIKIPKYNPLDNLHKMIVNLSKNAHNEYTDTVKVKRIVDKLAELYLQILKNDEYHA